MNKMIENSNVKGSDYSGWDNNTMCSNYIQYKKDNIKQQYNKVCVVRIETADGSIAFVGQELYYEAIKEVLNQVKNFFQLKKCTETIDLFAFDYKTFIVAGKATIADDLFIKIMELLHENFQHATSSEVQITGTGSFAIVMNQVDNVRTGIQILFEKEKQKESFIICDKPNYFETYLNQEAKAIKLIEYALNFDKVKPYYQGIRDNKTGKIVTYEALMRLIDTDGNAQAPHSFMEIAKKFQYMEKLTYIMIDKVLEDFSTRKENISINISVSDLESEKFQSWLFRKIEGFPEPHRIIVELLESDDSEYDDIIIEFIERLKVLGVKIAIDDFGVGYSTLLRVVNTRPQSIKIDGSIIKNICTDNNCVIIVRSIVFLARAVNATIVAEFVENEAIQSILEENTIDFSQGYLFSKPLPIENIA